MLFDAPPAIVYEVPSANQCVACKPCSCPANEPISLMAFGMADPNLGVYQENTKVHFYDHFDTTMNAKIVKSKKTSLQYSSMILHHSGVSSVAIELNLEPEDINQNLGLYLTHLSSDLHRGSYDSAIRILVNGQVFVEKYVPASHDWIKDDYFSMKKLVRSEVLRPGANTIEIQLHESAVSNYWIHCIKVQ